MFRLRNHRLRNRLLPLLSFVLLLQGLFPLQVHTVLVSDSDGRLVQVCTLHGIDLINIDPDTSIKEQSEQPLSAAMAFSSVMANAVSGVAIPSLQLIKQTSDYIDLPVKSDLHSITFQHLPIRAPPIT